MKTEKSPSAGKKEKKISVYKVPGEGVEPTHPKILDPKSSASASSAIQALLRYKPRNLHFFRQISRLIFKKVWQHF